MYLHLHIHQGYYISPILYFFRQIISWKNSIKSWFHLIILFYILIPFEKFSKDEAAAKNPILFHNQLLQFLFIFYSQNQLLQFLFLIINFLARLILKCIPVFLGSHLFALLFIFNCFSASFQQNIRIYKSLNDFHYVIHFFVWNY